MFRYASSNPLTMVDFSGLAPCSSGISATYGPPNAPKDVPWSNKDLTIRPGIRAAGYTAKCFSFDCTCSSCDSDEDCCDANQLNCTVDMQFHIFLDLEYIQSQRLNKDEIYGHEQRHVQNYVNGMNDYMKALKKQQFDGLGCLNGEDCRAEEDRFEGFIRARLESMKKKNSEHTYPEPKPGLTPYPPLSPTGPAKKDSAGDCFEKDFKEAKDKANGVR